MGRLITNETIKIDNTTFYYISDVTMDMIDEVLSNVDIVKRNKIAYINCPCSFDIEVSSFYLNNAKYACTYVWQMNINGLNIYGRTWEEFRDFLTEISTHYNLDKYFRLVIYVHNLSYEFQFMRKWFKWLDIFARKQRKPLQTLTSLGIMFKCSYALSGYSLAKVAENLTTYKIEKLKGDLDYELIRHTKTALTIKELGYCLNDVMILYYYIKEEIERNNGICNIPLTQTGYIRRLMKQTCYDRKSDSYKQYNELIHTLNISSGEEYLQLKRAFQGGFTHANAIYVNRTIKNVDTMDFSSSYPGVMLAEKFPMSTGELIENPTLDEFKKLIKHYCCIFEIEFYNIEACTIIEHPISSSKCYRKENYIEDNGRIVSADYLATTITELDYITYKQFYKWSHFRVKNLRYYKRGYLPTQIINVLIDLFKLKTELKDIENKESEYMHSKQLINSCFGMIVTDIVSNDIVYIDDNWDEEIKNIDSAIDDYNNEKQRFLFYPWGVYITAYARRNLFTGIKSIGCDYIYSDTDSIKCVNLDNHIRYITRYNDMVLQKNRQALKYHNIPYDKSTPLDRKGVKHYLGIWDIEEPYQEFKTLGAKRYLIKQKGKYNLTVSGVNKKDAIPYIESLSKKRHISVPELFDFDLIIPKGYTGKLTFTYIDNDISGIVTDYRGMVHSFQEMSVIHSENASYEFSISSAFFDYLDGIKNA